MIGGVVVSGPTGDKRINIHTSGWVSFAVTTMVILGFFHAISGIVALMQPDIFVIDGSELLIFDFTIWGWAHLVFGALLICVAAGLFARQGWAKVSALVLVGLSAVANFLFLPAYPLWSAMMIALDMLLVYAIAVHYTGLKQ